MRDGSTAPFKLEATTLRISGGTVAIDDTGMIAGKAPGARPMHVTGLTDDGSRRAVLLILGVLYAVDDEGRRHHHHPATTK